jgi:quercetin dioxygenase-like cupin family protein
MNEKLHHPFDQSENDFEDQERLLSMLSEHLQPLPTSSVVLKSLGKRLESRIQTSVTKHAGLVTVRSREGIWQKLTSGIRFKPLWESSVGNSVLIEFPPGAALPLHRHNYVEEGIVLSGSLQLDGLELSQFDYHVSPPGSRHGRISSQQGALAYLRGSSIGQPFSMFKEVLGGFLPKTNKESESVLNQDGNWHEISEGVFQKDLWTDGTILSRYIRIAKNTQIAGHSHPLDEECMMLSGDIFLGDILLQAGDYHVAPAGTEHLKISSDTGALLFVRGAV